MRSEEDVRRALRKAQQQEWGDEWDGAEEALRWVLGEDTDMQFDRGIFLEGWPPIHGHHKIEAGSKNILWYRSGDRREPEKD
jgi:hypothetical protein